MQIQRLVGSTFLHPIVIERTRTACKDAHRRVEHNQVRNVATREKGPAVRVRPLDDSHYVAVVLPVMLDGNFTLVGRYRYAIDRWSIELPRAHCRTDDVGWKRTGRNRIARAPRFASDQDGPAGRDRARHLAGGQQHDCHPGRGLHRPRIDAGHPAPA